MIELKRFKSHRILHDATINVLRSVHTFVIR